MGDDPLARLLDLLELEQVGEDRLRGRTGGEGGGFRLFGGHVAAQALRAAATTVHPDHGVSSLRAYFLRPGRFGPPIDLDVERVRDGTSFTTRRVAARQAGEAILTLEATFHRAEPGEEHQPPSPVPAVAPPEQGEPPERPPWLRRRPVDLRVVESPGPAERTVWMRVPRPIPDDPVLHACLITYLSDMGPAGVVRSSIASPPLATMSVSLDHCLWFHRPARADEWLLYQLQPRSTSAARGLAAGSIWTRTGELAVTLVQEVLIRPTTRRRAPP